jgi:hypothetical protein
MAKITRSAESRRSVLELLHGGKTIPESLLRKHMDGVKRRLEAQFKEKTAFERRAARYWDEIKKQKPSARIAAQGANATRAAADLRGIMDPMAKRKLTVPPVAGEVGGIIAGSYTIIATPPYDYETYSTHAGFGSPALSAGADLNSGELRCYVVTDANAPSGGTASVALGVTFVPRFSPAILQVSASPSFAYFWWSYAFPTPMCHFALTMASSSLGIMGFRGDSVVNANPDEFPMWGEPTQFCEQNNYDFGSIPSHPFSVQMEVDSGHYYVIFLMCFCEALADAWPGARAVASMTAALPSLTLNVQAIPVIIEA